MPGEEIYICHHAKGRQKGVHPYVAYVAPELMKKKRWRPGSPVLVCKGGSDGNGTHEAVSFIGKHCFLAWPLRSLAVNEIVIPLQISQGMGLCQGAACRLHNLPEEDIFRTKSVTVAVHTPLQQAELQVLSTDLYLLLDRTLFLDGMTTVLDIYGKLIRFTFHSPIQDDPEDDVAHLAAQMGEKLDVDEDKKKKQKKKPVFVIDQGTRINVMSAAETFSNVKSMESTSSFDRIGGLDREIDVLKENIFLPLQRFDLFLANGIQPPKGVLLYGPPGTGKTMMVRACFEELKSGREGSSLPPVHFMTIVGSEIASRFRDEADQKLRDLFKIAEQKAPTLIFIDEIDSLAPDRRKAGTEGERRVVTALLTLMDGLANQTNSNAFKPVFIVAATNHVGSLDPAIRRPGRIDVEIEIGVPTEKARVAILRSIIKGIPHLLEDVDLRYLAENSMGMVGADLVNWTREAALQALTRQRYTKDKNGEQNANLIRNDFDVALRYVKPSLLRTFDVQIPKLKWDDIGGQTEVKQRLQEAIEWPRQHADAFRRLNLRPPKGILLYGPPGCSKTMIARALASEMNVNFLPVRGPELFSKWVGESEKAVASLFRKARQAAPCVIFFDEIDAISMKRGSGSGGQGGTTVGDRVLSQLLVELDGLGTTAAGQDGLDSTVTVIAATNRPDYIDPALLRPGRMDRIMYIGLPDEEARREILRIHTSKVPLAEDVDISALADNTAGYSGAEIAAICREACLQAVAEDNQAQHVTNAHFTRALTEVTPRISQQSLAFYTSYAQQHSQQGI
eukprot:Clim_evm116s149 gene=Clim_evmTU116s149